MIIFEIFMVLCLTQSYISNAKLFQNYPESTNQTERKVKGVKDFVPQNDIVLKEEPSETFQRVTDLFDNNHNTSQDLALSNVRNKRAASKFRRNFNVLLGNSRGRYKFHSSLSKRSNERDAKIKKYKKKKHRHKSSTSILVTNTLKNTTPFAFVADTGNATVISVEKAPPKVKILKKPIKKKKKRPPSKTKSRKNKKHKRPTKYPNIARTPNSTELVRSDIGFLIESIKTVSSLKNNGSVATKKNGWNVFISNEKGSTTTKENAVNSSSLSIEMDVSTNIPTILMIVENFTEAFAGTAGFTETFINKSSFPDTFTTKSSFPEAFKAKASLPEAFTTKASLSETTTTKISLPELFEAKANFPEFFTTKASIPEVFSTKANLPEAFMTKDSLLELPEANDSFPEAFTAKASSPEAFMTKDSFTEVYEASANQEEMSKSKAIENDLKLLKEIMPAEETTVQEQTLPVEKAKEEDIQVNFASLCDYSDNNSSCWYEREVGDTLTLDLNITSAKDENTFVVRWKRMYTKRKQKQCVYMKLETERLPWNMVLGSANRELRIDPVTNTDMDPNALSAKVFLISKKGGKKIYLLIKEMTFHIQIPAIDMGSLYPGEELNINLENFLTLPQNGNLFFEWKMERMDAKTRTLPSNFKKSTSGRSIVVKEFKKAQIGIIDCVVYSSTDIAVAKRRFSINRLFAEEKRSLHQSKNQNKRTKRHRNRRISKRCNKNFKNIPERTALRVMESYRPISRKKRFRKTPTTVQAKKRSVRDCKHHNRLHARWIPSILDDDDTTLDPRVMPVQKLVELSENSDGTLDNVIPHEVHYVDPMVTVVTDYFLNYWKPPDFQPNCSTDSDCGVGALCVIPQGRKTTKVNEQGHNGYCYCKSAYFGDGFTCVKIPRGNHRDKRIRREISRKSEEFKIQPNLFYDRSVSNRRPITKKDTFQTSSPLYALRISPLMEYEDQDSYLVSDCSNKKDCSQHAVCFQGDTGHPYCKCNPGYRGNGIFCWEMIDYIKDKDQVTEIAQD